jgi:hypothetical protein
MADTRLFVLWHLKMTRTLLGVWAVSQLPLECCVGGMGAGKLVVETDVEVDLTAPAPNWQPCTQPLALL